MVIKDVFDYKGKALELQGLNNEMMLARFNRMMVGFKDGDLPNKEMKSLASKIMISSLHLQRANEKG